MCMGLPGSPSHRAHRGQGSPTAAGSSPAASPAEHRSAGWPGSRERSPQGTSGDEISHGQMQMQLRGSEARGGQGEAAGTPSRTAADTERHGAPARVSGHETSRAFIGSGCNPSASPPALHSFLQIWNRCGAADLPPPSARGWCGRATARGQARHCGRNPGGGTEVPGQPRCLCQR